jgi:RimJ/RimL family protein N-acetyltransferase
VNLLRERCKCEKNLWTECDRQAEGPGVSRTIPVVDDMLKLPVRSARLTFRELRESDFEDHERLFANPEVVRYLYDDTLHGESAQKHLVMRLWQGLAKEGGWANLAVEHDGQFLGEIGIGLVSSVHRTCEIGYVFLPEVGGRGFATEAARVAVDVAITFQGAQRVVARLDARNTASAELLERLGLRREAHFRRNEFVKGEWCDELVYAVLVQDWVVTTDFAEVRERDGAESKTGQAI